MQKKSDHRPALRRACRVAGSQAALASLIGVSAQRIKNWLSRDKQIPELYCSRIELALGRKVRRQELRPDDWREIWPELIGQPYESDAEDEGGIEMEGPDHA
ncbi:transcriptional regulator [Achromobacter animicus]|uniref:transcriptional regulator n=1 Tax=Achromobacter animicus TaxID=1389935 RepID=UPI00345EC0DF